MDSEFFNDPRTAEYFHVRKAITNTFNNALEIFREVKGLTTFLIQGALGRQRRPYLICCLTRQSLIMDGRLLRWNKTVFSPPLMAFRSIWIRQGEPITLDNQRNFLGDTPTISSHVSTIWVWTN